MNWFFKRRMKKGRPMSTKGFGDGLNGIDNCLATMDCQGGQIVRENGRITIIPNGSEGTLVGSNYWHDFTATATTETGEFKTTNNVTVGGLRADDTVATVGTSAVPFGGGYFGFGTTFNGARFHAGLSAASAFNAYWSSGGTVTQAKGPSTSFAMQTIKGSQQVTLCDGTDAVATAGDVNMSTGSVLKVAGTQVVKARLGALGAAAGTATNGGYGFVSQSEFDAFIAKVNSIIGALGITGGHGLTGD